MHNKKAWLRSIVCLFVLLPANLRLVAQDKEASPGTFKILTSKSSFGRLVKGAPYSATAITETVQTLNDGNQIIRQNQSKLYRDSEGRTRIEQTLETIGKWATEGEAKQLITINNPVTGFSYSLDQRTRTAYKSGTGIKTMEPASVDKKPLLKQTTEQNHKTMEPNRNPLGKKSPAGVPPQHQVSSEGRKPEGFSLPGESDGSGKKKVSGNANERRKTEALGKQMIEGVEVVGTRSTLTIPAGEIGNTMPIEVTDESWYSPQLQLMVMTRRSDPRAGKMTYRLTNLTRSEPNPSLFEVPTDYVIRENSIPDKPRPTKKKE